MTNSSQTFKPDDADHIWGVKYGACDAEDVYGRLEAVEGVEGDPDNMNLLNYDAVSAPP